MANCLRVVLLMVTLLCGASPPAQGARHWGTGPNEEAYEWWSLRTRELPPFEAIDAPRYLAALARAFNGTSRFRFYITDTLNTAVWSQGDGHFIIHGGLLGRIQDHQVFNFILTLEMAHDVLGHGATDTRVTRIPVLTELLFHDGSADLWDFDGFGWIAAHDPVRAGGRVYTLREEERALSLVSVFFARMGWDFDTAARAAVSQIPDLSQGLHGELGLAVRLPRTEGVRAPSAAEELVGAQAYGKLRAKLLQSTRQKYPWLLETAPFLSLVRKEGRTLSADQRELDKGAKSTGSSLSPRALAWLQARIHLNHDDFEGALAITDEALKKTGPTEPLLLQRLQAGLFGEKAQHCKEEKQGSWARVDYVRARYHVLCLLSDGELTTAATAAHQLRLDYPRDPFAAYLEGLTLARLRRPLTDLIGSLEHEWGDRPGLRALKLLAVASARDWDAFRQLAVERDEAYYGMEENGILDFSRAWGFGVLGESQGQWYLNRAARRWFPSRKPERILPWVTL